MKEKAEIKTVVIVGAGAMGCLFAARLAETGVSVTLVDVVEDRLATLKEKGVLLKDDAGERTLSVGTSLAADLSESPDLLMLFTKGNHSQAAIDSLQHIVSDHTLALTLQNGIGNAELLAEAFGEDKVLLGTAVIPADLEEPNIVSTAGFGHLYLGGFNDKANKSSELVANMLVEAKFNTTCSKDIWVSVWEKVAFNAGLNAIGMICELNNAGMNNSHGQSIAFSVVAEAVKVAAAKGIKLDQYAVTNTILSALDEHGEHKASMLQDREHGRATEIEMITGAIVREGLSVGVPTPVCDTLAALVRLIEMNAK